MPKLQQQQLQQIASRLKELRELSDYSVEDAANELGLSLDTYIAYEEAELDIPVSILHAAAEWLDVDLTELLTGVAPRLNTFCLVRNGQGLKVERYRGYNFQSLAYNFTHRSAEPLMVDVGAEDDIDNPLELVTHPGQEFNYVVEGTVRVTVGEHELVLNPGDSLYFDPSVPHGQRGVGGAARFLTIIL